MRIKLGNPVSGDDFWPRPEVIDSLFSALVEDQGSRRLFGLRRIGKTSVLLELQRRLRERPDLTVIRIDVQGVSRFKDFLGKVFAEISNDDRLKKIRLSLSSNPVAQSLLSAVWTRIAGTAAPAAPISFVNEFEHSTAWAGGIEHALREAGPVVLIVDELPFMLRNMLKDGYKPWDVERFLATLRSWRMNAGVRILLSGSLGLAQLKRTDGVQVADHIGDLFPEPLPPLARGDAIQMVEALAKGESVEDWASTLSAAIVDASAETWPIFLQYGFDAVKKSASRDPALVRGTIDAHVRRVLDETFYAQFTTRLSRYDEDEKPARAILKAIVASFPEPVSFAVLDSRLDSIGHSDRRDDLFEALREDDFLLFDTEAQTAWPASKLVPIWVRSRSWGR
jgi:hypothetical protein